MYHRHELDIFRPPVTIFVLGHQKEEFQNTFIPCTFTYVPRKTMLTIEILEVYLTRIYELYEFLPSPSHSTKKLGKLYFKSKVSRKIWIFSQRTLNWPKSALWKDRRNVYTMCAVQLSCTIFVCFSI